MKKRKQATLTKSSSLQKNTQEQPQNIGCMSGIFNFVSKYQRRRKFLTAGEKKQKTVVAPPVQQLPEKIKLAELGRFSCDIKRSPTIPSDIRRSESSKSPDMVAQLIRSNGILAVDSPESVAEKRRKLMESLQKCEEDLNSLKLIIEAVRSTDHLLSSTAKRRVDGLDSPEITKECLIVNSVQKPSPDSVLDISSSPSPVSERSQNHDTNVEALPRVSNYKDDDERYAYLSSTKPITKTSLALPFWSSKKESVDEVFHEAVWEERWELERIGAMLEDYMFGDLIEETITDLRCLHNTYTLPFEACRRRLSFQRC
ncbi:hypothetical protein ACHQM5_006886 [Ranunculus cassubicifolius]